MSDNNQTGGSQGIDIGREQLGKVYAKALLGALAKTGNADGVIEELESLVTDVLGRSAPLKQTLESPRISYEDKARILDRVFSGKMSDTLLKFVKVVGQRGRLDCLGDISKEVRRQHNAARGVVEVVVTTAQPISQDIVGRIKDSLRYKLGAEVHLALQLDPELIGGVVVRVGDKVFDASVANKLKSVRKDAVKQAMTKMREATDRFVPDPGTDFAQSN